MSTQITFVGHSTVLLSNSSQAILTDPVLSQRIFFIKRKTPLPMSPDELPVPSAIFISHAHYDHLDIPSFKFFPASVPIVLPKGLGNLLKKFIKNPLVELQPGEEASINPQLHVRAFAVNHVGFRLSGLTYRQCLGFMIDLSGTKIFFPGDTAYRGDFKMMSDVSIDCALLPIGPCQPAWLMRRYHMTPETALDVLNDIQARWMIPIHWGTFSLGLEPLNAPLDRLKFLIQERGLENRVKILNQGEKFVLS